MKMRAMWWLSVVPAALLLTGCPGNRRLTCDPGTTVSCYSGPAGTEDVGLCVGGTALCNPNGLPGPCMGEVLPGVEDCTTSADDDCDGVANEAEDGCTGTGCTPNDTVPCYDGPPGTENVGDCASGTATCAADGSGYGPCMGQVTPAAETCTTPGDDDCDGMANEEGMGCVCVPNDTVPCYSGPPGTEGVGLCTGGIATCNILGLALGPCVGEVTPVAETCATMGDDDCNGMTNESGAGCVCTPGGPGIPCYSGPPGTMGVGTCAAGMQFCNAMGTGYDACLGEVLPGFEMCDGMDHDCDMIPDNPPDWDGDGWNACEGDCCESTAICGDPPLVNPGAFEYVGNMIDDDCDPATSDTTAPAACSTTPTFGGVTPADVAEAMDLCQFTTATPPLPMRKWGVISVEFVRANGTTPTAAELADMSNVQSAILANYGTGGITPNNGPTMAGISSGWMRDENDPGYAGLSSGLGHSSVPPASYLAPNGGALPSSAGCAGSCPSGSGANDSINVRLTIRVPTNALSFSYQFRFFSYEYWVYSCTTFNDFYLALLTTGAAGIPADGNISFDSLTNPVSVNNSFFEVCNPHPTYTCMNCPSGNGELLGTGHCTSWPSSCTGGGTDWLTTTAPVVPGETMVLELMVFDVTDGILDSLALLDNFLWDINPSGVGTQ